MNLKVFDKIRIQAMNKRWEDALTLIFFLGLLALLVWTSYQVFLLIRGQVPNWADAGSYYWKLAGR